MGTDVAVLGFTLLMPGGRELTSLTPEGDGKSVSPQTRASRTMALAAFYLDCQLRSLTQDTLEAYAYSDVYGTYAIRRTDHDIYILCSVEQSKQNMRALAMQTLAALIDLTVRKETIS